MSQTTLTHLTFLAGLPARSTSRQFAIQYFSEAIERAPDWKMPQINLDRVNRYLKETQVQSAIDEPTLRPFQRVEKFLLIKAWGYGFWSDVSHVLGQLLVAELTGRTPIVHWGQNSLFGKVLLRMRSNFTLTRCRIWMWKTFRKKILIIGLQNGIIQI